VSILWASVGTSLGKYVLLETIFVAMHLYEYGYVAEEGHRYFVEILYTTARDAPSSPL
jgi:hypothetical protein